MKNRIQRFMAVMLVIIMALQVLPTGVVKVASAATGPSLSVKSKTVVGTDGTFTVRLLNPGKNVKRMTWYSQNEEVATIEPTNDPKTGKVTTVGKGVTYVKCKITYKNGSVKRPACKVTVKIAATAIKISNAQDDESNNNRQVIAIGDTYDFKSEITPSNANDNTYWVIDNGEDGIEYATVSSNGTVTGLKKGFVTLTAIASMSAKDIESSRVTDSINIEVVPKTIGVKDVNLEDTTTLTVTFDKPIDPTTVIGTNNKLLESVVITAKTDKDNVVANPLGELKASLSTDGKILTIHSQNNFDGLYSINLTSDIKGKDGVQLQEYFENLELDDKTAPSYKDYIVDATGLKVTINFTEAMDFTKMSVLNPRVLDVDKNMLPVTYTMLEQEANYKISENKKSLTIDLTLMSASDRNKTFAVDLSNIKDLAGNYPIQYPLTVYFRTDTTPKPQANLLSITRTSYNTLTASYDRPIQSPGLLTVNNNDYPQGKVDENDSTKVNYTLTANSILLTGIQKVSVGYWVSYNVNPNDTSAQRMYERSVDFTVDKSAPLLIGNDIKKETINGVETQVITFTYNKDVTLPANMGTFTASLITTNNDLYSNKSLKYTASASGSKVTIYISNDQMLESGTYTIVVPSNFVIDQNMNLSNATTVNIAKDASLSNALPYPTSIAQQVNNPSVIEIYFSKKVDEVSAKKLENYSIAGVTIQSVTLVDNNETSGARILLTLQPKSITNSTIYPITVKGIKGYNNTYSEMSEYTLPISLYENTAPNLEAYTFKYPTTVTLTFNEDIVGTPSFQVLQLGIDLASSATISGKSVIITLKSAPALGGTPLQVVPTQTNLIKDAVGNTATITTSFIYPAVN